jgi:hypothetical protein
LFTTPCEGFERPNRFCFPEVSELSRVKEDMFGDCVAMTALEFVIGNAIFKVSLVLGGEHFRAYPMLEKLSIPVDYKPIKSDTLL